MSVLFKVIAFSEAFPVEIRSKSRINRVEKLKGILEEGKSCFSLSITVLLQSQGKNFRELFPYMGAIQKAHEDREMAQPYLPALFLNSFDLKEDIYPNFEYKQLKETDFSSLIFIHFDSDPIFHVLALIKSKEGYGLFDANYKTLEVSMYPDVIHVRDQLCTAIDHYKKVRGATTVSIEKVVYST